MLLDNFLRMFTLFMIISWGVFTVAVCDLNHMACVDDVDDAAAHITSATTCFQWKLLHLKYSASTCLFGLYGFCSH